MIFPVLPRFIELAPSTGLPCRPQALAPEAKTTALQPGPPNVQAELSVPNTHTSTNTYIYLYLSASASLTEP